ncbi:hypothetical protein [Desertivirga arenae]|uniref:hypothetical protein n=1 Tax=Desertivirga arenae TaxID=2810309 RepID=UPI001A9700E5|nr:hypothetical protein [Pedobacter sp. SYSU D00823]
MIEFYLDPAAWNGEGKELLWDGIKTILEKYYRTIGALVSKSINILIPFHQQIFGNEFREKKGYFTFESIQVLSLKVGIQKEIYQYQIELGFSLNSEIGFVMDELLYYTTFDERNTLVAVQRF